MANQTAMQEMYFDLIQKHIVYTNAKMYNEANSLISSIELAEHLIYKEKQQIINAAYNGADYEHSSFDNAEQYYNETYSK